MNLDFPQADIAEINRLDGKGFEIIATFFGLYGVASPLPGFYTEELLDEEWDDRHATREFIDIIHHQMYPMLYRAWLKYRFAHNSIEEEDPRYREIIYSLIGMGEEFRGDGALAGRLLRYAGIISQRPRTLVGLKTILNDSFSELPIDIEPCVPRYVNVPEHQKCRLGDSNNRIGEEAVIGQEVCDRASKYLIRIGPLDSDAFNGLINDDSSVAFIRAVTKLFLMHPLQFDIELLLKPGTARPVELGVRDHASLGRNTWLVSDTNTENYSLYHA